MQKLTDKHGSDQKKVAEKVSDMNRSESLLLSKGNSPKSHENGMKSWVSDKEWQDKKFFLEHDVECATERHGDIQEVSENLNDFLELDT